MNNQLKQRLVGAVVLVALAVIFIPMLLPGEGDLSSGIKGSNIPPEPDFRFPPVPKVPKTPPMAEAPPVPLGDDSSSKSDKPAAAVVTPSKPKPAKTVKPAPVAADKPATTDTSAKAEEQRPQASKTSKSPVRGWVVQVGSFSDSNNAKTLRDKLRKQGYACFVEDIKGKSGRVYRVRVGPELTREAAEQLQQRLTKRVGLTGLVQAYP